MAFTLKYRYWALSPAQESDNFPNYMELEALSGPWDYVFKDMELGLPLIRAHNEGGSGSATYGPFLREELDRPGSPHPVVWVMNESGATVAKYEL